MLAMTLHLLSTLVLVWPALHRYAPLDDTMRATLKLGVELGIIVLWTLGYCTGVIKLEEVCHVLRQIRETILFIRNHIFDSRCNLVDKEENFIFETNDVAC